MTFGTSITVWIQLWRLPHMDLAILSRTTAARRSKQ
jgi:hypothetical protein